MGEKKTNERLLHSGMNYLYFYAWKGMIVSLLCGNGLDKFKLHVPTIQVFFVCGKWALGPWHTRKWKQTLMDRKDCEFKQYVDANHWVMVDQSGRFNQEIKAWLDHSLK